MMVFLYIFFKLGHYSRLWSAVLLLLLFLIPITAYFSLKTFRSKIHYVIYEVQQWKSQKQFDYNLSDAGRLISYKMGLAIIEHHPVSGVGAGDVRTAMKEQYNSSRPDVPEENILVPHNQFLYTALAVGIPFTILLVFMVVAPFFTRSNNSLYLSITSFILWVAMMVEAMLEIQFGIFVYLFFILFWMAALKRTGYDVQKNIKSL
jgi:O-antigen ligase